VTHIVSKPLPPRQQYCPNCGKALHSENSDGGFCIGFCREQYEQKLEREREHLKGGKE
jgi:hypothetical protein